MSSRRAILQTTAKTNSTHVGLWLDKFLSEQPKPGPAPQDEDKAKPPDTVLVAECSAIPEPTDYPRQFDRWLATLHHIGAKPRLATVNGRLAIGLGNETVIETGATIHQTYGVPIIRGSALKGLASAYSRQQLQETIWQKGSLAHNTLFGSTDSAGFVTFFDALPQPGTWKLHPDIITVHHPDYYRGTDTPPADWDNPTPIPFLTVTGNFLVALYAPDAPLWADVGYGILGKALSEMGIGAKTSSGYGRLSLRANPMEPPFQLQAGALVRAIVTDIQDGDIILQLRPKYAAHLPADKESYYIYIPRAQVGDRTFRVGAGAACIILQVYQDEYEYTLTCRPATQQERQE